eukprot:s288_g24.t1
MCPKIQALQFLCDSSSTSYFAAVLHFLMGSGAATAREPEEESVGNASSAALLLIGACLEGLNEDQRAALEQLRALLEEDGWKKGNRRKGANVHFKYSGEAGLNYVCSTCRVPDSAAAMFEADAMMPAPTKVNYNGFEPEKKKKPEVTEATIDPSEIGLEKCQKIVKEQEFKIRKLKEKMAGIAPTKKNKAEIAAVKEQVEELQADGNYRAAMNYVRKAEEDERDKRRAEREKDDEEALVGGLGKKKGPAGPSEPAPKKQAAASSAEVQEVAGDFDADAEVVAVVKSAVEGSEDALAQLQKGAGAGSYKSAIKAEVASIASAAAELISAKMKRAATRDAALKTLRALSWNPPATLPALPALLLLLEETKLKGEPGGTAADLCRVVCSCGPKNSAVPEAVFPVLLAHLGAAAAGKWKVKVAVLQLLRELLQSSQELCPRQTGLWMPKIMSALRDAVGDARKEVKKEAESFLRSMAKELAQTPEIRTLADDIITSILDSANMEKATETLHRMANTTFLNTEPWQHMRGNMLLTCNGLAYFVSLALLAASWHCRMMSSKVDSCAFALLFPTVSRAMREQAHDAKMKGVQIVGASVHLIADPVLLQPYLQELMPLLEECLLHPTVGVQHEAAKSFGSLAFGLPEICDKDMMPFLLKKLQSQEQNEDVSEVERRGAARGLAEVLLARRDLLPGCLHDTVLPRIPSGETIETKAGGLQLIQAIASLGPQAFLPHLKHSLPFALNALQEESEVVHKQAVAAVKTLIDEYGATAPHLLLPRMQEA